MSAFFIQKLRRVSCVFSEKEKKMKEKKSNKFLAMLLSLMMAAAFVPTLAFAEGGGSGITVYLTVSDGGSLAKDRDGDAMAWKEVSVTDIDGDGKYSFDEALYAAHKKYNRVDGYEVKKGQVKSLWGTKTTNCLFFIDGAGLENGVTADMVNGGDYLTASINADQKYYADWMTKFEKPADTAPVDAKKTLKLSGHLGMAWTAEQKTDVAVAGAEIGVMTDGTFDPIGTTDENGSVSVTFNAPGTYIVAARGTTTGTASDWGLQGLGSGNTPPFGTIDFNTYESTVAYTDADYGEGPYPADEIKYIDFFEPAEDGSANEYAWQDLHYLKSNSVIVECPLIAAVCIITVKDKAQEKEDAIGTINDLNGVADMSKYRPAEQMAVLLEIVKGTAAINAAQTAADARAAYDAAVEAIGAIITLQEYNDQAAKKVSGFKVTRGKKKATVKWTKDSKNFDGYQLYYKSSGKSAKTVKTASDSFVVKKLKSKKKCTFKVRGYKTVKGVMVYGKWTASKTVKIK